MWGIVLVISTMPHFITTHSINNPNYIKMQQNKNQQLDAKFRKFIKVLIMAQIQNFGFEPCVYNPSCYEMRQQAHLPTGRYHVI